MTAKLATKDTTEGDLEARANSALRDAMPWLKPTGIKHQLTFSFKLGHKTVDIDGAKSSKRYGRLDILIQSAGKPIAILELKRPNKALDSHDLEQGLSYARVLHPRPPVVVVSNGIETRTYATHTGELLSDGVSTEQEFSKLIEAAMNVAESDLSDAIATLMGPSSDVWMSAVRAATDETLDDLTGNWDENRPIFTDSFHISRKASMKLLSALRGSRRVIAVEGAPLIGKSHVLRELAIVTKDAEDMAVLLVEASGTAATGIKDEIARLLGAAVGWRISTEEAQHWLEGLGAGKGPQLIIAIDGLGFENSAIRQELEALTAIPMGSRLKFVIEADTSVVDRLWQGESRRKDTVFARRGDRVLVDLLDDEEFEHALKVLEQHGTTFMRGADKADEYRQPWLLRSMAAGIVGSPEQEQGMVAILPPLLSLDLFRYVRERFVQDDLTEQAATFARAVLDDYARNDRPKDVRLRAMHSFMVRKKIMRGHADAADIGMMTQSGLVGSTLDSSHQAVLTGRIPELLASELARLIAADLAERMGNEEKDVDAADWLVSTISDLPMGDVIGAQALVDLMELQLGTSLAFMNQLLQRSPSIQPLSPGTQALAWLPSIGQLDLTVRANGVTVIKKSGWTKGIELPVEESGHTYADLDSWLILSHLASVRIGAMAAEEDRIVGLLDPAILALVGTSTIPLRRASDDLERSGLHMHDAPDGSSMVCREDGIVEPVTFSLLRFLDREQKNADDWLDEACDEGSPALLNRLSQALLQLASMNKAGEMAQWARDHQNDRVGPALQRALAPTDISA